MVLLRARPTHEVRRGSAAERVSRRRPFAGHLFELDFVGEARSWRGVDPASLYSAPVAKRVREENRPVERNLHECARRADTLTFARRYSRFVRGMRFALPAMALNGFLDILQTFNL